GGSVMIPASLSGVVGLKPTYGTVSTEHVIPLSESLDTVGPLAPSAAIALTALEQMTGRRYTSPGPAPDWSHLRVAIPAGWVADLDEATAAVWQRVSGGVPEVTFPARSRLATAFLPIFQGETAANHRERLLQHAASYQPD